MHKKVYSLTKVKQRISDKRSASLLHSSKEEPSSLLFHNKQLLKELQKKYLCKHYLCRNAMGIKRAVALHKEIQQSQFPLSFSNKTRCQEWFTFHNTAFPDNPVSEDSPPLGYSLLLRRWFGENTPVLPSLSWCSAEDKAPSNLSHCATEMNFTSFTLRTPDHCK